MWNWISLCLFYLNLACVKVGVVNLCLVGILIGLLVFFWKKVCGINCYVDLESFGSLFFTKKYVYGAMFSITMPCFCVAMTYGKITMAQKNWETRPQRNWLGQFTFHPLHPHGCPSSREFGMCSTRRENVFPGHRHIAHEGTWNNSIRQ